jgi:putative protein kinase ArgK-like GTPase of G3E family
MLALKGNGPAVPVLKICAPRGEGIAERAAAVDAHREYLLASGESEQRRQQIQERRTLKAAERMLHDGFERHRLGRMAPVLAELATGQISPQTAALHLLAHIGIEVEK